MQPLRGRARRVQRRVCAAHDRRGARAPAFAAACRSYRRALAVRALRRSARDLRHGRSRSTIRRRPDSSRCTACRSTRTLPAARVHSPSRRVIVRALQWGGRFGAAADAQLLAFGSSLEEDLVLAPFDVACSLAHVEALRGGRYHRRSRRRGVDRARCEPSTARSRRSLCGVSRARRRRGRSRGDRRARPRACRRRPANGCTPGAAATIRSRRRCCSTSRDRARAGARRSLDIAESLAQRARDELRRGDACRGLHASAAGAAGAARLRAGRRGASRSSGRRSASPRWREDAARSSPLGSAALAGSSLPLDREAGGARARL